MSKPLKQFNIVTNDTVFYLLISVLLAVPLYPKFPLFFIPGVSVAVRLEDVLIALTLLAWGLHNNVRLLKILKNKLYFPLYIFFLFGAFSVYSSVFVTETASVTQALLHWARRVEYISLFFVASTTITNKRHISLIFKSIIVIIIYAFIYGVLQKYFSLPVITTQNQEYAKGQALFYLPGGHLISTFAGHYDLAGVMVMFSPFMYVLLTSSKKNLKEIFSTQKHLFIRLLLLLVIAMSLWLLVHAASRISILAYFIVSSFTLFLLKKYAYIPVLFISIIIFISLSSNLMSRYMSIFNVAIDRVISYEQIIVKTVYAQEASPAVEDRSTSIRLNVEWPRAVRALRKNPVYGTGYSSITLATDNDYLRALGETGLYGFVALFSLFVIISTYIVVYITQVGKKSLESFLPLAILASLPGLIVTMVFIDILEASKFAIVLWLLLGSAVSVTKNYEK